MKCNLCKKWGSKYSNHLNTGLVRNSDVSAIQIPTVFVINKETHSPTLPAFSFWFKSVTCTTGPFNFDGIFNTVPWPKVPNEIFKTGVDRFEPVSLPSLTFGSGGGGAGSRQ